MVEYRYSIATSEGLVPRLNAEGAVEFVRQAAPGQPAVFTVPVGNMFDSAETLVVDGEPTPGPAYSSDVAYDLRPVGPQGAAGGADDGAGAGAGAGWELVMRPDMGWLRDPARVYPVMIDPTVTRDAQRDCTLMQDQPNTISCGDNARTLRAGVLSGGNARRSVLKFETTPAIPAGANITHANLELWLTPSVGVAPDAPYVVQRAGRGFSNGATWNSSGSNGAWSPRGGQPTGAEMPLPPERLNGNGPAGWRYFNVTAMARGWHEGTFPEHGMVLKQRNENVVSNQLEFLSSSAQNAQGRRPNLNIIYTAPPSKIAAAAGERDFWEFEERELNDRMSAMVNIGNGNLMLEGQDASVAGVAGWDLAWTRYYNSATSDQGGSNLGAGWSHGFGGSVRLDFPRDDASGARSRVRFFGPSGYQTLFDRDGSADSYTRQRPGIKAHFEWQPGNNRYELRWYDESRYHFDAAGQLQSTQDANGNRLEFTYRQIDNRLGSVTDTRDRTAHFLYRAGDDGQDTGLVEAVEIRRPASAGGGQGDPQGGEPMLRWEYTYDQPAGGLARMSSSRLVDFDDDAIGGTTTDSDAGPGGPGGAGGNVGAVTTYSYTGDGRLREVVDARGSTTRFGYDANTPRVASMTRVTDDGDGEGDVPDSVTGFEYFATPNASQDGTCKPSDETGSGDRVASYRTHVDGERLAADVDDTTRYCIDDAGRVLRTTDARGNKRSSSWSDNSNVETADMSGTGEGQTPYEFSYDEEDENLEQTESPEGSRTGATYDGQGSGHNPAAVQGDDSGGEKDTWTYTYDDDDNLIRARSGVDPEDPSRDLEITYEYCWTGDGQIRRIMPGDGDGDTGNDDSDNVDCSPGGQGDDTILTYNNLGELATVDRPSGGDQSFTYDNLSRIKSVTDGRGVQTSYTYDAMDRVVEARHTDAGGDTPEQTVTWDHDTSGNLVQMGNITDPDVPSAPAVKEFSYDALNRLTSEAPQDPSTETSYTYDPAGNLREVEVASETAAGLEPTSYTYNAVNKVVTLDDQRPGDAAVTFGYDNRDNRIRTVFSITGADGTDNPDRLVHQATYDQDSNPTCLWSYRQTNGPTGTDCDDVEDHDGLITYRGYDYDNPAGQRTSTKYTQTDLQDRTTRFAYDPIKRLEQATTRNGTGGDDQVLRRFAYDYSPRSNMTEKNTSGTTPGLETGRLQMAYSNGDEICASLRQQPDAGNLGCGTTTSGQTTYNHDGAGNMTAADGGGAQSLGGLGLGYNLPRQTTSITPPGGTQAGTSTSTSGAQAYDGVEQDRRTVAGDTTMSYGYAGHVTAQNTSGASGSGATGQLFVRDPGGDLVAMLSRDPADPGEITDVDYYLTDDQNTVMATHDGQGDLTDDGLIRYLYEPYGHIIRTWTQPAAGQGNGDGSENGQASTPTTDLNPFTYVSGYHDRATGLVKFGTRYYIPSLGTWTQPDPLNGQLTMPLTLNKFDYSLANPCNNDDPSGRSATECVASSATFIGTSGLAVQTYGYSAYFTASTLFGSALATYETCNVEEYVEVTWFWERDPNLPFL